MGRKFKETMKRRAQALCRYCVPFEESGRKRCGHCNGWRLPSRRAARRASKNAHAEIQAY
jgi:hypothetical protein